MTGTNIDELVTVDLRTLKIGEQDEVTTTLVITLTIVAAQNPDGRARRKVFLGSNQDEAKSYAEENNIPGMKVITKTVQIVINKEELFPSGYTSCEEWEVL